MPLLSNDWRVIAAKASVEMDSAKLMILLTELDRVLGEREAADRLNRQ